MQYQRTPLQLALFLQKFDAVRVLAECKATLEAKDEVAVLQLALACGDSGAVRVLDECKADLEDEDKAVTCRGQCSGRLCVEARAVGRGA